MIDPDQITADFIGSFLKAFPAAPPVTGLQWLAHHGSEHQRTMQLYIRLEAWTVAALNRQRLLLSLPTLEAGALPPDPVAALREDFASGSPLLEAWSAVYHRYFAERQYAVKDLCQRADINKRRFYRRLDDGLASLARLVLTAELEARQNMLGTDLYANLPQRTFSRLIGRDALLARLRALLDDPRGPRIISLEGMARIGKTAIARQFAEELTHYGLLGGLAWVTLAPTVPGQLLPIPTAEAASPLAALQAIARQLGSTVDPASLSLEDLVQQLRTLLVEPLYLVVLDGLDAMPEAAALLEILRPLTLRLRVLITTRRSLGAVPGVEVLAVDGLDQQGTLELLTQECARFQVECAASREQLATLHEFVIGHPAFISLVALLLRSMPLSALLDRLAGQLPDSALDYLINTFDSQLLSLERPAARLMLAMAYSPPGGETRDWLRFVSGLSPQAFARAEEALAGHYLINRSSDDLSLALKARQILRVTIRSQLARRRESAADGKPLAAGPATVWMLRGAVQLRRTLRTLTRQLAGGAALNISDDRLLPRYYAVIDAAHDWPQLETLLADLIIRLHPRPLHNGDWATWQPEMACAAEVLGRTGRHREQARLLLDLATLASHSVRWEEAIATGLAILEIARTHALPLAYGAATYTLCAAYVYRGEMDAVAALLRESATAPLLAGSAPDDETRIGQVWLAVARGLGLRTEGKTEGAYAEMLAAERLLATAAGSYPDVRAQVLQHQGILLWMLGENTEAEQRLETALRIAEDLDDIFFQALVQGNLGLVYLAQGRLRMATSQHQTSIHYARQHGASWQIVVYTGNLAVLNLYRGNLAQALETADSQLAIAEDLRIQLEIYRAQANRGMVLFHMGRTAEAISALRREKATPGIIYANQVCTQLYLGRAYALRGQYTLAWREINQAKASAADLHSAPLDIVVLRVMAEVARNPLAAREWLEQALAMAVESGRDFDRAACLLSLAALAESEAARQARWEEGAELLTGMDADAWLDGASPLQPPRLPALV